MSTPGTSLSTNTASLGLTTQEEMDRIKAQAEVFWKSGLLPAKFKNPEQVIVAALHGRELGLSMQRSLNEIHVIEGKPALSANLQLALVRERCPKAVIRFKDTSAKGCTIEAARNPDEGLQTFSFTIQEAQTAGLIRGGSGWQKFPEDMCVARAITRMTRRLFSDVLGGMTYTPEELLDAQPQEGQALRVATAGGAVPKRGPVVDVVAEEIQAPEEPVDFKALDRLQAILEMAGDPNEAEAGYQAWTREPHNKATLTAGWEIWQEPRTTPERAQEGLDEKPAVNDDPLKNPTLF